MEENVELVNNEDIIKEVAKSLKVKAEQVRAVLQLLSENATIPFIARYRKEVTGNLDENQIFEISNVYDYQENLKQRKADVIRLIDEKGLLTKEIEDSVNACTRLVDVENIYQPYKEGKKTKAAIAKEYGLEPLAKDLLSNPNLDVLKEASKYLNENVTDEKQAIAYALDIIAFEATSNPNTRLDLTDRIAKQAIVTSKEKKNHEDDKGVFKNYYDFSEKFSKIANHRLLGINRGVNKNVLTMKIEVDDEKNIEYLYKKLKVTPGKNDELILAAVSDGYKRLLLPSILRAIYSERLDLASTDAIELFANNLEQLLLVPPLKNKRILGFDPGIRTGCKLAIIDEKGDVLKVEILHPFEKESFSTKAKDIFKKLLVDYKVDIIAIGNGTASRESEMFVSEVIKENNLDISYAIVSEIGASVYSASKIAQDEFPQLTVEKRSAISIARRLLDPLSELIKIDPKSIGVGQYQHDVNQKQLNQKLDFVVEKIVNEVGVDLNTASPYLLSHVSGLNKTISENIVNFRSENGSFNSRAQLKKVPKLGPKAFEQAAGFLTIKDGKNILDGTIIHPESYKSAQELFELLGLKLEEMRNPDFKEALKDIKVTEYSDQLNVDKYTLETIKDAVLNYNVDVREKLEPVQLKKDVLTIDDVKIGEKLQGVVRNIVDFGAFVDIGLKNDGLVHLSKISNKFIKHPSEVLNVNDIVEVTVIDVDTKSGRISLSMRD